MRYACVSDISIYDLSVYSPAQLRQLAVRIAERHQTYLESCTPDAAAVHLDSAMEFGVTLGQYKSSNTEGKCKRVCDPAFWQRSLSRISGRTRESVAVANRQVGTAEQYCSDASFQDYLTRQSSRSCSSFKNLRRQIERLATQPYLITKAAGERAFDSGYLSVFITLVLDAPYRSSSPLYRHKDFDSGYQILSSMQSSLLDHISLRGKRGVDFYGARCVEVHLDGCPHFHTLLFIKPDLLDCLKQKLKALHHSHSIEMAATYDKNENQIIKVRSAMDGEQYHEAVSYIFKNSYAGRNSDKHAFVRALRQKTVISIYGKHQYELIGMTGSPTMIRELPKYRTVDQIAKTLQCGQMVNQPRANWLKLIKVLISGGAKKFRTITTSRKNRYGEEVKKTIGIAIDNSLALCRDGTHGMSDPVVICNYYNKIANIYRRSKDLQHGQFYPSTRLFRNRSPPCSIGNSGLAEKSTAKAAISVCIGAF